jgi:hypothetical protein
MGSVQMGKCGYNLHFIEGGIQGYLIKKLDYGGLGRITKGK